MLTQVVDIMGRDPWPAGKGVRHHSTCRTGLLNTGLLKSVETPAKILRLLLNTDRRVNFSEETRVFTVMQEDRSPLIYAGRVA